MRVQIFLLIFIGTILRRRIIIPVALPGPNTGIDLFNAFVVMWKYGQFQSATVPAEQSAGILPLRFAPIFDETDVALPRPATVAGQGGRLSGCKGLGCLLDQLGLDSLEDEFIEFDATMNR